jgi:hypothetical protein
MLNSVLSIKQPGTLPLMTDDAAGDPASALNFIPLILGPI